MIRERGKLIEIIDEAERRWPALPSLDQPIVQPPDFRGYSSSDLFSLLALAIPQSKPRTPALKYFNTKKFKFTRSFYE